MKIANIKKIIAVILVFGLTVIGIACDPAVEYNRVIQNNSDFDVKVLPKANVWYLEGNDTIYGTKDTLLISKHTSKIICGSGGVGSVYRFEDCEKVYDSIPMFVYFKDSIKIIPNIQEVDGWNFRIIKEYRNRGGICECRLILTNEMLTAQ